jgi:uncharacterized protein (TIGR01319 family)
MAVLQGAILGAQGGVGQKGWGDLLVVDVGGATTDVHSVGYGEPSGPNIAEQGLPEPFAKRTVEGDLGIRFNAGTLLDRVGGEKFATSFHLGFPDISVTRDKISHYIAEISQETSTVPREDWHSAVDAQLARIAADLAVARHVGKKERIVTREGEAWVHYGKDLTETRTVIGTGGVFVHNPFAVHILAAGIDEHSRAQVLRPKNPNIFADASYLLYAVGLLAENYPDVAMQIFDNHMRPLGVKPSDDLA